MCLNNVFTVKLEQLAINGILILDTIIFRSAFVTTLVISLIQAMCVLQKASAV